MSGERLSYVHGGDGEPLKYLTIGGVLEEAAQRWPDKEAVVVRHQNIRMTYRALDEAVNQLAAGLASLGFERGERIGIWSPNNIEWVVTQFATAKLGLVLVNINPAYRIGELEYVLNKVECSGIIIADAFKTSDYCEMIRALAPDIDACAPGQLKAAKLPHLKTVICI